MAAQYVYKDLELTDIINWCQAHGEVAWLKAAAQEKVQVKVYPRIKVAQKDENGQVILNKDGKPKYTSIADKSQEPTVEEKSITFIQLKKKFAEKFMPEILPKAEKKETMYDIIAAL